MSVRRGMKGPTEGPRRGGRGGPGRRLREGARTRARTLRTETCERGATTKHRSGGARSAKRGMRRDSLRPYDRARSACAQALEPIVEPPPRCRRLVLGSSGSQAAATLRTANLAASFQMPRPSACTCAAAACRAGDDRFLRCPTTDGLRRSRACAARWRTRCRRRQPSTVLCARRRSISPPKNLGGPSCGTTVRSKRSLQDAVLVTLRAHTGRTRAEADLVHGRSAQLRHGPERTRSRRSATSLRAAPTTRRCSIRIMPRASRQPQQLRERRRGPSRTPRSRRGS